MNRYLIEDIGNIYQNIANSESQVLNEDSEYYDEELSELVEDIFSKISISMVYEGYSAEGVISFLENSEEDIIIQEYLNFDHRVLVEGKVSEDYILEQLEIFDFAINEGWKDKLITRSASFLGRIASKPARMKAADRLLKSSDPARTAAAYQKLANKNLTKAGGKVPSTDGSPASLRFTNTGDAARTASTSKAVAKVKDIAKGAKAALTSPTAKKIAVGSLLAGTGVLAGYFGSGNGGSPKVGPKLVGPKIVGPKIVGPKIVGPKAPVLPPPSGNGGGGGGGGGDNSSSGGGNSPSQKTPKKLPSSSKPPYMGKTPGGTEYERRTPTLPELEAAQERRAAGGSEEEAIKAGVDAGKQTFDVDKKELEPLTKFTKSSTSENQKTSEVESALKAEQEKLKKKAEQSETTTKESYDAYEIVLEYLIGTEQVDTLEEAHYVMLEMNEESVGNIVEEYKNYLLSEEITEWVNELMEEGYDLSQYTWDDMIDHYFSEAKVDKVVDQELKNAGVSANVRTLVKKSSRKTRNKPESLTRTQQKLRNKLSDIRYSRQEGEEEISGARRGSESSTEY